MISQTKSTPRRRRLVVAAISLALLLIVVPVLLPTHQPRVEVSLANEPVLRSGVQPPTMPARLQTNTELPSPIQEFHVTLQFKNLGPGSVRLEVRPFYHLEIRRTNSAVWQEIGKTSLRLAQILRPGAASLRPIRIPADAAQFRIRRVRCRSWNTARQTAKGILQAFKIQFSPETFYTTDSPAWDLPAASIDLR